MLQKIFYIIVLLVLCVSTSFAGNGFFIEGGIGSRYLNGNMNQSSRYSEYYTDFEISRDPLNEAPLDNYVTDQGMLGWKSKLVGNYNATIGYRFSDIFVSSISAHYVPKKGGGFGYTPSNEYPNVNTNLGENIQRNNLGTSSNIASNWFSQLNLRATQYFNTGNSVYFIVGVEYSALSLKKEGLPYTREVSDGVIEGGASFDADENIVTYKDHTYGFLAGIGFELPISHKMSLMSTAIYVDSSYKGDKLYYAGLDFNIGGFELGYTLRYYLK